MSPDESFIARVLEALERVGLEALIVGNAAAALQGAPVTTRDLDLLVRDSPKNREKIDQLGRELNAGRPIQLSAAAHVVTLAGTSVPVDLIFDQLSGDLSFESVRSRCSRIALQGHAATVASLEDVIRSKEAADRPKDRASLPILRESLRVKQALAGIVPNPGE